MASGTALSADSRATYFVAWIPPDRKRHVVIQSAPFLAEAVAVAADGTIWASGPRFDEEQRRLLSVNVIQRYDTSGRLLSSSAVAHARSEDANSDPSMSSRLLASRDRVGWFTNGCQYIEFLLNGTELKRFDGPAGMKWSDIRGMALSEDNDLLAGRKADGRLEVLSLDRVNRAWVPVSLPDQVARGLSRVLGFDGTTLVTSAEPGTLRRFGKRSDASAR